MHWLQIIIAHCTWVLFTVHFSQQSTIWTIRSWYQNLFSLMGDIKTKSTGYPSFFSHPGPTPLWSQFTRYCLTSWENACPHGRPSFSLTLCYCHHFICTQVAVSKPCPLSEFCTNKAPKICNPLMIINACHQWIGDSSSLLIKLEFRHTGFVYEAISILHWWQKKMILLARKKLRTKMVMILLISALPVRSNSLTWWFV